MGRGGGNRKVGLLGRLEELPVDRHDVGIDAQVVVVPAGEGQPGRPVVIAIHGITGSHLSWAEVAAALDDDITLVAPDVNQSGVTVLMVEQNVTFGLGLVDRAFILQSGRVVYGGDVAELEQDRVAALLGVGKLLGQGVATSMRSHRGRVRRARS